MSDRVPISQLTREQWIKYKWFNVTEFGDGETMLLRGFERTPDEAAVAADRFDLWLRNIRHEDKNARS